MKKIIIILILIFSNKLYANYMIDVQDFSNICNYTFKDNVEGIKKIEDKYTLNPLFLTEEVQCNGINLINVSFKYKSYKMVEYLISKSRKEFLIKEDILEKAKKLKNEKLIKIIEKKIK